VTVIIITWHITELAYTSCAYVNEQIHVIEMLNIITIAHNIRYNKFPHAKEITSKQKRQNEYND